MSTAQRNLMKKKIHLLVELRKHKISLLLFLSTLVQRDESLRARCAIALMDYLRSSKTRQDIVRLLQRVIPHAKDEEVVWDIIMELWQPPAVPAKKMVIDPPTDDDGFAAGVCFAKRKKEISELRKRRAQNVVVDASQPPLVPPTKMLIEPLARGPPPLYNVRFEQGVLAAQLEHDVLELQSHHRK